MLFFKNNFTMEMSELEIFRLKRLIKFLDSAKGSGTSLVTLALPPGEQISRAMTMLTNEHSTASNIKSRVNRLSVLGAIVSCQQKLKLLQKVPENGLVIFSGTVMLPEGKEKKVAFDIEPFRPISQKVYACDSVFHTECLSELLYDDQTYGFIIVDGSGALFATLSGSTRTTISSFQVCLPKKHGRGGQSALRFERLRKEKRHNYLRKVAENASQCFLRDNKCFVSGIVLAGSAEFKTKLLESDLFDTRLKGKVLGTFDIPYGGEAGLSQAIDASQTLLGGVKYAKEKEVLSLFFREISKDKNTYCFGKNEAMTALELGAVETLIVFQDSEEKHEGESFIDWICENYKNFGCSLELVSNSTPESSQFIKGFGGIGCILRYPVEFQQVEEESDDFW
ncbi:eukaryotic peptide chain release factor [Tunisvirus fontaine2]|uniref:Eukaryotic peptide chain release factor n=1 Tax=Tunisvirus fontaine2 TaxID=1421067 RepID=V9SGA5_9VIRU|nr:eukaryotic peptide chain release factor [Tunisvirus fontaine2]AHC54787.1 eukaryotic peptide chain release factor [Tunisvirus fontaine2]